MMVNAHPPPCCRKMRRILLVAVLACVLGAQSAWAVGDVTKLQIGVKVILIRPKAPVYIFFQGILFDNAHALCSISPVPVTRRLKVATK